MSPFPSSPPARSTGAPARKLSSTPARQALAAHPLTSTSRAQSARVDHWTMVLFYAMGVGVLALVALFFVTLIGVGLYGQFVWTFTQWDLGGVKDATLKFFGNMTMGTVFLTGTAVGLWFFSGYAWKNLKVCRNSASRTKR